MKRHSMIPWNLARPSQPRLASDPFLSLNRTMNQLFDNVFSGGGLEAVTQLVTPIDVRDSAEEIRVAVELPGVSEDEVEVTVEDGVLTIRGEKQAEEVQEGETLRHVERRSGRFERRVSLSAEVDVERAEAVYDRGVLRLSLPKLVTPETKRTIAVRKA